MEYNTARYVSREVGPQAFQTYTFPVFDNEEPPLDYGDNVLDVEPLEAIQLELDTEEDAAIIDWFYGPKLLIDTPTVSGPSYRYWSCTLPVMANLYCLGRTLLSRMPDNIASYLFDKNSFFTAKALNMAIPGGLSRIDRFSLGPIEEGSKRGRDGSRGAGVLARGTRSCT